MNKLSLALASAAMLAMTAACSSDNPATPSDPGNDGQVVYEVTIPQEIASRTFSDGTKAYRVLGCAFDHNTQQYVTHTWASVSNLSAKVIMPLANGVTYDVVFWAVDPMSMPMSLMKPPISSRLITAR